MNADLQGMKRYYFRKKIPNGLIVTEDGTPLTSDQTKKLIEWRIKHGYNDLHSLPDFREIKELQNTKNSYG